MTRYASAILSLWLATASGGCSCSVAHAQSVDENTERSAALTARDALILGAGATDLASSMATTVEGCGDGTVEWDRGTELGSFCATTCSTDADCASDERCRVLTTGAFVADAPDDLLEAAAMAAAASEEPIYDDAPVCDAECAPYDGDLELHPVVPLTVCDPLWNLE